MNDDLKQLFASEVKDGLSAYPKQLSSKWFYNAKGDELFVQIMNLPEYYLTKCEEEIFSQQTEALVDILVKDLGAFDLYELGAGDGTKTMHLLSALRHHSFTYRPIDISANAISNLEKRVAESIPQVHTEGLQGEYFEVLSQISSERPKVILFMGSNIGNMLDDKANAFLLKLSVVMQSGDRLLLGVDLKKDPEIILPAYNDSKGITSEFNLNLLDRINHDLGANFNREEFRHTPHYDEERGVAYSYITSLTDQKVKIKAINSEYHFAEGEKIFTEVSRKYDDQALDVITDRTSLKLVEKLYDSRRYFCDAIFEKA